MFFGVLLEKDHKKGLSQRIAKTDSRRAGKRKGPKKKTNKRTKATSNREGIWGFPDEKKESIQRGKLI